jgi:hypothetical protein
MSCDNPVKYITEDFRRIINGYAEQYTDLSNSVTSDPQTAALRNTYFRFKQQKKELENEIQQLKSSTERYNRDFIDLEDSTTPNTGAIHVLDDYTLWVLMISYILFACSIVFWYSHTHMYSLSSIFISLGGMTLISFLLVVMAIIIL